MKYCRRCGSEYGDSMERCPEDGEALLPVDAQPGMRTVQMASGTPETSPIPGDPDTTNVMARDIEDLIFKVCSECHSAYAGGVDICPRDGSRLLEPSTIGLSRLLSSSGIGHGDAYGGTATAPTLKLKKYCPTCKLLFDLHLSTCGQCDAPLAIPTLARGATLRAESGPIDSVIEGKYRLLEDIGAGAFGSVYLAKHESLGKHFAIKMLRGRLSDSTEFRNRFHEEALKLSRLEDDNIVKVFDFGEWSAFQYMATEYVSGEDLTSIIYTERISPLRAAKIMIQVAGALAEAHSKNIVHLDLKPANVLIARKRGRDLVKVIDFGIAELYSARHAGRQRTVAGTCTYMAPEQWKRGELDPRTDIYSFGVIFYEALAGRPPFRERRVSALKRAHIERSPPPLRKLRPDIPAELERLVDRCLEKKPERRFQSAEELESLLASFIRRSENVLGRWILRAGVIALVIALLGGGAWAIREALRDRVPPTWVRYGATVAKGEYLKEEESSEPATKSYKTRAGHVLLSFVARDDEAVERLVLHLPGLPGDGEVIDGPKVEGWRLQLELGRTRVSAEAVDASGNTVEESASMVFERLRPSSLVVGQDGLRRHTNLDRVHVVIQELEGSTARLLCRREDDEPHFACDVEKDGEGRLGFTVHGQPPQLTSKPGDPLKIPIPLKAGENTVTIAKTDILTGETSDEEPLTVEFLAEPLELTASILEGEETLQRVVVDGVSLPLTSSPEIAIQVRVAKAWKRLKEGASLRYRKGPGQDAQTSPWKEDERRSGTKVIRLSLEEGRNDIQIEMDPDRFGNPSKPLALTVVRDRTPPSLKILEDPLDFYGEEPPPVPFQARDDHLAGVDGFELLDAEEREVPRESYRIEARGGDDFELRLVDRSIVESDGTHEFCIRARDRAGNPSTEAFTIRADHQPPGILDPVVEKVLDPVLEKTLAPPADRSFRRGDRIRFRVRLTDAFPESVRARVRITIEEPGGTRAREFPLRRVEKDIWGTEVLVRPRDVGSQKGDSMASIEKPSAFLHPSEKPFGLHSRPGFHVEFIAQDAAGHETTGPPGALQFEFAWETGDRLLWEKDGSILAILVYHDECFYQDGRSTRKVAGFFLATTEVSNGQYQKFLESQGGAYDFRRSFWDAEARHALEGVRFPRSRDWKDGRCPPEKLDWPVRGVSWYEARAYASWAGLRLPTRDEWLVAAFWGYEYDTPRRRTFPWGDGGSDALPVHAGDKEQPVNVSDIRFAAGQTPLGLRQMLGNVWELVSGESEGGKDGESGRSPEKYRMGGGYKTAKNAFRLESKDDREYLLLGESYPEADHREIVGFRCALGLGGNRP